MSILGTLHLQGTVKATKRSATPMRYSYAYEVQLLEVPYNYTFEIWLHLFGTATQPHTRHRHIYKVGTATPKRYVYTYEIHLPRRATATHTRYTYIILEQLYK